MNIEKLKAFVVNKKKEIFEAMQKPEPASGLAKQQRDVAVQAKAECEFAKGTHLDQVWNSICKQYYNV
jgi:hypothetical protein